VLFWQKREPNGFAVFAALNKETSNSAGKEASSWKNGCVLPVGMCMIRQRGIPKAESLRARLLRIFPIPGIAPIAAWAKSFSKRKAEGESFYGT
jgi:hypothetical protein